MDVEDEENEGSHWWPLDVRRPREGADSKVNVRSKEPCAGSSSRRFCS